MARPAEELEFVPDDVQGVLAWMDHLGDVHRGWINLQPGIREEDVPPRPSGLGLLFALPAHDVPVCTWVPGRLGRRGAEPDSVGIQHAASARVVVRLAELGFALPEGWRWTQDNPKRGLVVRTPPGTGHDEQLTWLLGAGAALSTVPLTGEWRALVYEGR